MPQLALAPPSPSDDAHGLTPADVRLVEPLLAAGRAPLPTDVPDLSRLVDLIDGLMALNSAEEQTA